MIESYIIALTTFFATVGPVDVAGIFAALTVGSSSKTRRRLAIRGTVIASLILVIFTIFGNYILMGLGISLAALKVAGGILLMLMSIEMVFARSSGATSATAEEQNEASGKGDISVFPLATPLIAGPGAMGAAILLVAETNGALLLQSMVFAGLITIMLITLVLLLLADKVSLILGVTGMQVVSRVFGVLLSALAVQFIFDGMVQSGLVHYAEPQDSVVQNTVIHNIEQNAVTAHQLVNDETINTYFMPSKSI